MMKRLLLFGSAPKGEMATELRDFVEGLRHLKVDVSVENQLAGEMNLADECATFNPEQLPPADMAVSLGGDGTFLRTAAWGAPCHLPILGINTGHLGYLTAGHIKDWREIIDEVLRGDYVLQQRTMLQAHCNGMEIAYPYALNEVAIMHNGVMSVVAVRTWLNDTPLTTYSGDGLVMCTPTGSTAYNLSVGGPILEPTTQCLVLSPISPHSLSMRPVVIPDDTTITVQTSSQVGTYQLCLDGKTVICPSESRVVIRKAPFTAQVVQRRSACFAVTLRNKLHWGTETLRDQMKNG